MPVADNAKPSTMPRPCRHFARGNCLYGDRCKYLHIMPEPKSTNDTLPLKDAERQAADAAFVNCENRANSLRKAGAPREELLAVVRELDELKARRRALPAVRPLSRFRNRPPMQNSERAGVFRRWLCYTFGTDSLRSGSGVLDVAGGHGSLAFELVNVDEVPCTIVDPRPVERGFARLERKWKVLGGRNEDSDALTSAALASDAVTDASREARALAARLVHRDWRNARERQPEPRRPGHWRMCWQPELYDIDLRALPSDEALEAFGATVDGLLTTASGLKWTRKGLVPDAGEASVAEVEEADDDEDVDAAGVEEAAPSNATASPAVPPAPLSARVAWQTLADCSLVAGMHADGATEHIVDFALQHDKAFAVVPCCVYSGEARELRRDATTGLRMATMNYAQFVRYLVAKAPGEIRTATLPFQGKNVVVYRLAPGGPVCDECEGVP